MSRVVSITQVRRHFLIRRGCFITERGKEEKEKEGGGNRRGWTERGWRGAGDHCALVTPLSQKGRTVHMPRLPTTEQTSSTCSAQRRPGKGGGGGVEEEGMSILFLILIITQPRKGGAC